MNNYTILQRVHINTVNSEFCSQRNSMWIYGCWPIILILDVTFTGLQCIQKLSGRSNNKNAQAPHICALPSEHKKDCSQGFQTSSFA